MDRQDRTVITAHRISLLGSVLLAYTPLVHATLLYSTYSTLSNPHALRSQTSTLPLTQGAETEMDTETDIYNSYNIID